MLNEKRKERFLKIKIWNEKEELICDVQVTTFATEAELEDYRKKNTPAGWKILYELTGFVK